MRSTINLNRYGIRALNMSTCGFVKNYFYRKIQHRNERILYQANKSIQDFKLSTLFFGANEDIALNFKFHAINEYVQEINSSLQCQVAGELIEKRCKLASDKMSLPWESFEADVSEMIKTKIRYDYYKYRLLTFFLWAAKNNRSDLFEVETYKKLFDLFPEAASESILAAAAYGFDSINYLRSALQSSSAQDIMLLRSILCIIVMKKDLAFLTNIVDWFHQLNVSFKSLSSNSSENNPLYFSIHSQNDAGLDYLLSNGMDPNNYRNSFSLTLLHVAVYKNNKVAVARLLQHGMNVNAKAFGGVTPLHDAISKGEKDIARILVENKADLFANSHDLDNTPTSRPIDYIADDDFKAELLKLSQKITRSCTITSRKQ